MADVTGPISSLPGSRHEAPSGIRCDWCDAADAVVRVQGETDSFGCEMHDVCQKCADEDREQSRLPENTTGRCDWCKENAADLRPRRDYEEGMCGRVYDVCGACVKRQNERDSAYLDSLGDWD
jgi:hypothetical protein